MISASDPLLGRYSDGRTSRLREVALRVEDGDLIATEAAEEIGRWPLSLVSISPRLGRAPRTLMLPEGARIEVADVPLLDEWFSRPPSRIEHWADALERHRTAIVLSAVMVAAGIVGFVQFGLPWMAHRVAERIPPSVERSASDQVVKIISRQTEPSQLPEARQQAIQQAFRTLVAGEPRVGDLRLSIIHAPGIGPNAFALPDGRIFLTDELVKLSKDDDEIIAVLAHEAGHHVYRHGMRNAVESLSVAVLASVMLGDASGSSLTVALPAALLNSKFSRSHETEADNYSFRLLKRHGRSPAAFARIMKRLMEEQGMDEETEGMMGYMSSHPASMDRVRAAEAAAKAP